MNENPRRHQDQEAEQRISPPPSERTRPKERKRSRRSFLRGLRNSYNTTGRPALGLLVKVARGVKRVLYAIDDFPKVDQAKWRRRGEKLGKFIDENKLRQGSVGETIGRTAGVLARKVVVEPGKKVKVKVEEEKKRRLEEARQSGTMTFAETVQPDYVIKQLDRLVTSQQEHKSSMYLYKFLLNALVLAQRGGRTGLERIVVVMPKRIDALRQFMDKHDISAVKEVES